MRQAEGIWADGSASTDETAQMRGGVRCGSGGTGGIVYETSASRTMQLCRRRQRRRAISHRTASDPYRMATAAYIKMMARSAAALRSGGEALRGAMGELMEHHQRLRRAAVTCARRGVWRRGPALRGAAARAGIVRRHWGPPSTRALRLRAREAGLVARAVVAARACDGPASPARPIAIERSEEGVAAARRGGRHCGHLRGRDGEREPPSSNRTPRVPSALTDCTTPP